MQTGYFKEKELTEKRGEVLDRQDELLAQATEENRDLTPDEQKELNTLEKEYQKLTAQIDEERDGSGLNGAIPYMGGSRMYGPQKLRVYNPGERMAADHRQGAGSDIGLNDFLRAAVTKPATDHERNVVNRALGSDGYTLPVNVGTELIDRLRARNPLIQAGARSIMLDGAESTKMVRIIGDPTAEFLEELAEQDLSDPNFDSVDFTPHTVRAVIEVSRELQQDSQNLGEALALSFTGAINDAILQASFTGSGSNEPTGLNSAITAEHEYANATDPDWSDFVKAGRLLHTANVPSEGRAHVMAPDVWEDLALSVDSQNRFQDAPSFIRDIANYTSSGVPEGIGYAGDFTTVVYGWRSDIRLEQFPAAGVRKYSSLWLCAARLDMKVFRPASLVRILEANS